MNATSRSAEQEREHVIATVVLAFVKDPFARWLYPQAHQYLAHVPRMTAALVGKAFENETADHIAGFAGAALWLPPGIEPDKQQILDVLRSSVGPDRLPTLMAVFDEMGSSRPEEPHWYLPVIGVDPAYQGRGHGHALLHHGLERVDDEGKIAYLENTNPDYTRLYESHGFRVVGTIEVAEAPPLIQMLRPAQ